MMTVSCTAQTGPAPISGDVPEATGWRAEVVIEGLDHPGPSPGCRTGRRW
ncbi:MAG: hypothetical protein R3F40_14090 [Candidatus Competibacteraceae bacterium]